MTGVGKFCSIYSNYYSLFTLFTLKKFEGGILVICILTMRNKGRNYSKRSCCFWRLEEDDTGSMWGEDCLHSREHPMAMSS